MQQSIGTNEYETDRNNRQKTPHGYEFNVFFIEIDGIGYTQLKELEKYNLRVYLGYAGRGDN